MTDRSEAVAYQHGNWCVQTITPEPDPSDRLSTFLHNDRCRDIREQVIRRPEREEAGLLAVLTRIREKQRALAIAGGPPLVLGGKMIAVIDAELLSALRETDRSEAVAAPERLRIVLEDGIKALGGTHRTDLARALDDLVHLAALRPEREADPDGTRALAALQQAMGTLHNEAVTVIAGLRAQGYVIRRPEREEAGLRAAAETAVDKLSRFMWDGDTNDGGDDALVEEAIVELRAALRGTGAEPERPEEKR